jgi:chromosome segregation ATPase
VDVSKGHVVQETKSKASEQVQGLQAELRRVQREVESFKAVGQKHEQEVASLSSSCSTFEGESAKAKARAAVLEEQLTKSDLELRRLQGYVKQLTATQRVKDAQVTCWNSVIQAK